MKISIVIPAHNEEKYIGRCLASINEQVATNDLQVETIVVLNRCTDKTEDVAKSHGATVVSNDSKNLSEIRNTGVSHANTEWVITIDADSWMSKGVLAEIHKHTRQPNALGGGIRIKPERLSPGIAVGYGIMLVPAFFLGLSFGMYWFKKSDFDAIGGFDEKRHIAEDVDFLRRLKTHGRKSGRRHTIISVESITTSCRKFDEFGDWHFVRIFGNPCKVIRAMHGGEREYLDKNWYEGKR
ncbi:MAG: glycosyltransferase [Oceanospirillaceae bacterium]|nr:glycosyltransferase [Oceanospirillaceae bacterium]